MSVMCSLNSLSPQKILAASNKFAQGVEQQEKGGSIEKLYSIEREWKDSTGKIKGISQRTRNNLTLWTINLTFLYSFLLNSIFEDFCCEKK
jgi:hypothetical protein